jgi:hypothetical protein
MPEFSLRAWPVPVVLRFDPGQRSVSFGHLIVNLQRFDCRRPRFWVRSLWRKETKIAKDSVAVGQTCISQGVVLININRLLEVLNSFLQLSLSPLVPEIASLKVGMISLVVLSVTLRQQPSFFSPELSL